MYVSIKKKFLITCIIAILWVFGCFFIDKAWFLNLVNVLGFPIAVIIVIGIAILPGVMICFYTIGGVLFDKPKHIDIVREELEPLTILIAAYNEENSIYNTLKSLSLQDYPIPLIIKVIDNNSKDNTKSEIEKGIIDFPNLNIEYLFEPIQGKFAALNLGLSKTNTKYFITIDADTYLFKNAIITLANKIIQENKNKQVAAIAGTVLVRNSRTNLLTKLQEWEYFLSIASIKRSQGLFQTTMVVQGAFSIYNTEIVKKIGGYKDTIAEDIVLTWEILSQGEYYRTYYCDNAIAFTNVPTTVKQFARQRKRWARGSIEGFRHYKLCKSKNPYNRFYMLVNSINMVGEVATTFIFIPGVILAIFFHNFLFVSWCTVVLFFVTLFIYLCMWHKQLKYVFEPAGLKVRKHYDAFVLYVLIYAMFLAPICLEGYLEEVLKAKRKWK